MEAELLASEAALKALQIQYEQYFVGVTRRPPLQEEEALRLRLSKLRRAPGRRGALAFRIENLHQKFLTYQRMWARTVREIEEGTYRRDLARLKRKVPVPQGPNPAAARRPTPAPPTGDDPKLRKLYEAWVEARKRCNQRDAVPTYEQMKKSISKQVPTLLREHKAKKVDFQVVIRDGKALLKAIPRS